MQLLQKKKSQKCLMLDFLLQINSTLEILTKNVKTIHTYSERGSYTKIFKQHPHRTPLFHIKLLMQIKANENRRKRLFNKLLQ